MEYRGIKQIVMEEICDLDRRIQAELLPGCCSG